MKLSRSGYLGFRSGYVSFITQLLLIFSSSPVIADETSAINWLLTQQDTVNRSFVSPDDTAHPVQTTSEALLLFEEVGILSSQNKLLAAQFVIANGDDSTEFSARHLIAESSGSPTIAVLNALIAEQNADLGYGSFSGHESTPLDSAYALMAFGRHELNHLQTAATTANYLIGTQQTNGAWTQPGAESAFVTALAMRALSLYAPDSEILDSTLEKARNYLMSQRQADLLWSDLPTSMVALLALTREVSSITVLDASIAALRATQNAGGSWGDDVYSTALAVRVLSNYEARRSGTEVGTGAFSGSVFRSGSTEPISNAGILIQELGLELQTNPDGFFVAPNLRPETYTLTISKPGHKVVNRVVTVETGDISLTGNIYLQEAENTGILTGIITTGPSNQPVADVQIALIGAANYAATS